MVGKSGEMTDCSTAGSSPTTLAAVWRPGAQHAGGMPRKVRQRFEL
jgi:hypothetical protein